MAPLDKSHTSFYWRFMITMALSCIISEIKRDIGRKSRFFNVPPAFDAPVREEYCCKVRYGKTTPCFTKTTPLIIVHNF